MKMRSKIFTLFCFHALSLAAANFRLLVLHTNDMHSRFAQMDQSGMPCNDVLGGQCYGGFPRLKTAVDRERKKAEADPTVIGSLFLNAGDTFQGTELFTNFGWKIVDVMLPKIGVDVVTLGNHEFDNGVIFLKSYMQNLPIPVVCCNLDTSEDPSLNNEPKLMKSIVKIIKGKKIGIIGYLTPHTKELSITGKVKFEDEVLSIRKEAEHLTRDGVHIIIALGHSGFEMDKKIAREVYEVDLVIGGHDNTFLYNGPPPDIETPADKYPVYVNKSGNGKSKSVPVVQAFHNTKYLGALLVEFSDDGEVLGCSGNPILLDSSIEQDPSLLADIKGYEENIKCNAAEVLGSTTVYLKGSNNHCRYGECELGNFITDSFVFYNSRHSRDKSFDWNKYWTDAPIAVIHSGSIRNDINKGTITHGNLSVAIPMHNVMGKVIISGLDIKNMFETAFKNFDGISPCGEFLQVSGLRIVIDLSQPGGNRVQSISVKSGEHDVTDYHALDLDSSYTILISQYMWNGGNGFRFTTVSDFITLDKTNFDIVREELALRTPLLPVIDGRITLLGLDNIYKDISLSI